MPKPAFHPERFHKLADMMKIPGAPVSKIVGAQIRFGVGQHSTPADFAEDWITTHEMVHLAFPAQEERHDWIEEGQARVYRAGCPGANW